jgi:hypothetical protein
VPVHFAHQTRREYYNGVKYADAAESRTDLTLGIQGSPSPIARRLSQTDESAVMSERGGIVGRGVLLDFVRYAAKAGIDYNPCSNYAISLDQIEGMIQDEKLTIRQGDILIIRTGLSKWNRASTPESGHWGEKGCIGVDPTPELFAWIWNQNLGAVASDSVAFECVPAPDGSSK